MTHTQLLQKIQMFTAEHDAKEVKTFEYDEDVYIFLPFFYHMSSREILLYMSIARGGLGQNFRPGNLTLIQAIPYTHNKL